MMTILDGVGIREGIIKKETHAEPVKVDGGIVFRPNGNDLLVGDGPAMHQGGLVGSAAASLDRFTMQRTPNGGWVVSSGSGALIGAFSSFDEAVGWLKPKVAK